MNRRQKTQLNISVSLLYQFVIAVCGIILPRFILTSYGSEANGLMQSISQLLGYTTIMEFGIASAARVSFYKPLANGDDEAVSDIFNFTKRFFNKISVIFIAFSLVLALSAKLIIDTNFGFWYVFFLVGVLAINVYFNYYVSLTYQLLLKADQKLFVVQSVQIITTIFNLVLCIIAIKLNATIHTVKLITAFVFLLNPVVYRLYVKKHYRIDKKIYNKSRTLPKRTDTLIHHVAFFVHTNTDVVIISIFKGVIYVSVYAVYNMVINAIQQILSAISTAVSGAVGNMIAKEEKKELSDSFELYESINTFISMSFFAVAVILIIPFVKMYTSGVCDSDYIQPVFAYLMITSGLMYCIRMPYNTVITSAGHYKETKVGAIGEVVINLVLSLLLVKPLGLSGVAIGTLSAMSFRTGYMVWYLSKNILHRPVGRFVRSFGINILAGIVLVCLFKRFLIIEADSLLTLVPYAIAVSVIVFIALAIVNLMINYELVKKVRK